MTERDREQAETTRRYDRNAFLYDLYDWPMDVLGGVRRRRKRLLGHAEGRVLEIGVGTGRNLDLYPPDVELCGIDISERMLFSMVSTLRPYGRAIFLRSRLAEADFGIPAAVGVHSIGIDIAAIAEPEAEIASRLEKFAENAHRSGLRCHVHGLSTSSLSLAAVSSGFDYLAGDAIAPCADAPWGVQPFDAESLFLRRLATADA